MAIYIHIHMLFIYVIYLFIFAPAHNDCSTSNVSGRRGNRGISSCSEAVRGVCFCSGRLLAVSTMLLSWGQTQGYNLFSWITFKQRWIINEEPVVSSFLAGYACVLRQNFSKTPKIRKGCWSRYVNFHQKMFKNVESCCEKNPASVYNPPTKAIQDIPKILQNF